MIATIVAGLLAALPAAGALPLLAEPLAEPAPTDVGLAWESRETSRFVVTWQETGALGNKIDIIDLDGNVDGPVLEVAAGAPNRIVVNDALLPEDRQFRVRVVAVDAAHKPVSDPALSATFDTDRPADPIITSFVPGADTITLRWRPGTVKPDSTPNDPLDVPADQQPTFIPIVATSNFNSYEDISPPTTATTFVFKKMDFPEQVGVRTANNGFGYGAETVYVAGTRLTATVPTSTTDGARMRVTGKVYQIDRACDPGPCWTAESAEPNRVVQLQSRTGSTAPWKVVGTDTSTRDGNVQFTVVSPGTRQYRLVAPLVIPPVGKLGRAYFATAPVTTVSRPRAAAPGSTPGDEPGTEPGTDPGTEPGDGGGGNGGGGNGNDPGDGPALPITGGPVTTVAGTGAVLLAAGLLLYWVGRRRRTASLRAGS